MKSTLSAVLITYNEEADLPACLESVRGLASEIIVVDSGSADRTQDIALSYTPHVHRREFTDYAGQKQAALELATGEWVLSIDADERVSPELAREFEEFLKHPSSFAGFRIPYEVHFMGRALRFGGLGAEEHLRFFRRDAGRFVGGELHEGIEVRGPVGRLRGVLRHFPYHDLDDYLDKMRRYTTLAAQKRWDHGGRFSPLHHLLPFWELFVRIVLRLGILDGTPGITWWGLSSFHTWVKFLKLRDMERQERRVIVPKVPAGHSDGRKAS